MNFQALCRKAQITPEQAADLVRLAAGYADKTIFDRASLMVGFIMGRTILNASEARQLISFC